MFKLVNHANYLKESNRRHEIYSLPSMTVPGMVPSLQELVQKYVRGENVAQFNPVYDDSDVFPMGWEGMDEMERIDFAEQLKISLKAEQQKMGRSAPEKTMAADPEPDQKLPEEVEA